MTAGTTSPDSGLDAHTPPTGGAGAPLDGGERDGGAGLPALGRTKLGTISISDSVVSKIAARAAVDHPDAGAAATRLLGLAVPGARHVGGQATDLAGLPKASVEVDGASAFLDLTIGVRWPANIAAVTGEVRDHIIDRVHALTGLTVEEVHITVRDLVTDIPAPPRVR